MGKTAAKKAGKSKQVYPAATKFYKDQAGEWRWRIKKGRHITAASTEGYINLEDCKANYYNTFLDMARVVNQVFNNEHDFSATLKATFVTDKTKAFTL